MATINLSEDSFEQKIDEGIVFVDWWAPWCGPCKMFAPVFEKASDKHGDVTFAKVNTEDEPQLAGAFGIRAIPTLMVFREGVLVFEQPGLLPGSALDQLVTQVKALDMEKVRAEMAEREAEDSAATAAMSEED